MIRFVFRTAVTVLALSLYMAMGFLIGVGVAHFLGTSPWDGLIAILLGVGLGFTGMRVMLGLGDWVGRSS